MKRRTFLARSGQLTAVSALSQHAFFEKQRFVSTLAGKEEATIAAVLRVLLPSTKDSPGAVDINAFQYLLTILSDPEIAASERRFLKHGILRLERYTQEEHHARFYDLPLALQEETLRSFVTKGDGESWVSNVLTYALEALFGDPIYGINVNEIGWKWIDHHSGFPRPLKRKWYRNP